MLNYFPSSKSEAEAEAEAEANGKVKAQLATAGRELFIVDSKMWM